MASTHFTIPTRTWDERSYLQGLKIWSAAGVSLAHEADPDGFEVHAATLAGKSLGKIDIPGGGHSSSVGLESTSATSCNIWFGHEAKHAVGFVTYQAGQTGVAPFTKISGLPYGDASVDQAADLLCIRSGNHYSFFRLSAAKVGKIEKRGDFSISGWGKRFQGHLIVNGLLFVHRDVATKAESRVHVFDYSGKPVVVTKDSKTYIDTTRMGDEAEGLVYVDQVAADALEVEPGVYVVKRTGGTGPSRVLESTRISITFPAPPAPKPPPPPPPVIDTSKPTGKWVVLADKLAAVDHKYGDGRDPVAYVRDKGYVIDTGDRFVTAKDSAGGSHVYLVTQAGYRYALSSGPDRTGTPYLKKIAN